MVWHKLDLSIFEMSQIIRKEKKNGKQRTFENFTGEQEKRKKKVKEFEQKKKRKQKTRREKAFWKNKIIRKTIRKIT